MPNHAEYPPAHRYHQQWEAYRRRSRWLLVAMFVEFFAFFPFLIVMEDILKHVFPKGDAAFGIAMFLFMALFVFTGIQSRRSACPRCGKNFAGGFFDSRNVTHCVHCNLREFERE